MASEPIPSLAKERLGGEVCVDDERKSNKREVPGRVLAGVVWVGLGLSWIQENLRVRSKEAVAGIGMALAHDHSGEIGSDHHAAGQPHGRRSLCDADLRKVDVGSELAQVDVRRRSQQISPQAHDPEVRRIYPGDALHEHRDRLILEAKHAGDTNG